MKSLVLFVTLIILSDGFLLPREKIRPTSILTSPYQPEFSNKIIVFKVPKEQVIHLEAEVQNLENAKKVINNQLVLDLIGLISKTTPTLPPKDILKKSKLVEEMFQRFCKMYLYNL